MKSLSKIFLAGMAATVPIAITIYILYWLGETSEKLAANLLHRLLPSAPEWPGGAGGEDRGANVAASHEK